MTTLPVAGFFSDSARINSEAKTAWDDLLKVHRELQGGSARTELTIAAGSITPTGGIHTVDTEADAATDILDNIVQTNHPNGRLLIISTEDEARDVTVTNAAGGAGQIFLNGAPGDFAMISTTMRLILQRSGTSWLEIGRFYGSQFAAERARLGLGTAAVLNTGTAEGDIPLVSDARMQGRHTLWIPASDMTPTTTNGAAVGLVELVTNDVMRDTLDFNQTTLERAQFSVTMPKSWDHTSTIQARFQWTAAAGAGNVVWGIKAIAYANSDPLDVAFGTTRTAAADVMLAFNKVHASAELGTALTPAGTPADTEYIIFQVIRLAASDTLSGDAMLLGVELYITLSDGEDT